MKIRFIITFAMIFQFVLIVIFGSVLFQYNMKIRQIDKELEYIDQILVTDNSKLKIFKAKYAWLSSPEMIMNLSKKYLAANGSFDIGLDASRTYNFAAFSLKVKPRLLTSVNSKLVE